MPVCDFLCDLIPGSVARIRRSSHIVSGAFPTSLSVIFSVIVIALFPGRLQPPVCDFLCDYNYAVSGAMTRLSVIFFMDAIPLFPGRLQPPVCDFLWDCNYAVSGAESSTEEVSARHRNRDCAALTDIGSARCLELATF